MFDYFSDTPGAFVVLGADFVAMDEGTGIVQMAPGFGEDDQRVCEAVGIPVICPVDDHARFSEEVADLAGVHVFDANARIIERLAGRRRPREGRGVHPQLPALLEDRHAPHLPGDELVVRGRHGFEGPHGRAQPADHLGSRARSRRCFRQVAGGGAGLVDKPEPFLGDAYPRVEERRPRLPRVDVYGSLDELAADFGVRLEDLHRPGIDELTRPNPDDPTGASLMRRIPDVLDCWFESGSMPFAQLHYPFENERRFEEHFPADFIVEYVGQTRGWFYSLHVLATALFDRPPFKTCIAHGIVLGDDGRKLSKRLRNFPDPEEVFAAYGADAMRWYMLSSPVLRGLDVVIENKGLSEPLRLVLNPIWNTWYFLSLYANADGLTGRVRTDQTGVLDRYVLAKTRRLVEDVTAAMHSCDLAGGCAHISAFLDALTNWYVRRSRDRFWRPVDAGRAGGPAKGAESPPDDKQDAYDTLAHRPRGALAGGGAVPPLPHRGRLRGPHGRAQRAPAPLAGGGRAAGRPGARRCRWTSPARSARRATPSARRPGAGPACPCRP